NHSNLATNQVGRQRRQLVVLTLCPAIFDRHVLALDIASFFQALAERAHKVREQIRRSAVEESDHRHRRLLRARRERPCSRRAAREWPAGRGAADERDECAALHHSITSSAIASSVGGTVRPSALAAFRLITSSNLVDCTTGMRPRNATCGWDARRDLLRAEGIG